MKATWTSLSRRAVIVAGGAAALAAAGALPARAQARRERVSVAVGAEHSSVYQPWDLAQALGYFAAEGLDVSLSYTRGGSEASVALSGGSADFSGNAIDHAIAAQAQGKSLVMIADFMGAPGISFLIRNADREKYKSFKDLKGKTVGITSPGSATHVLGVWLAKQSGLARDDVKYLGVGAGATVIAAMDRGVVDAAFATDPFATELIRSNRATQMINLFDPRVVRSALGFPSYAFTGALTRGDVIQKKPETVQKIVNALVRAQKFMSRHTSLQVAQALPDEMRAGIPLEVWAAAYSHSRPAFTTYGRIEAEGVHSVVVANQFFLAENAPKNVNEAALFDNSFVERANKNVKA
ncbi:MAG: ABC transporter substrate-binding protein [Candidatus Eremiobacteraeota bacterium]|nr:ABC transporter substrate-binding protein [Candidatus Eremiobacteraeota bacterium]